MEGVNIVLLLACVSSSSAFFFRRQSNVVQANGPVDQACLALAVEGSCDFYSCFENRLPCGRDGYMVRIGQHYCSKMQTRRSRFTPGGQNFINNTQQCLTQAFQVMYQLDQVNCVDLQSSAIASITSCFVENAFCDILEENVDEFFRIYEFSDLFHRNVARMWRTIASLAVQCGHEAIRELSSNTGETIIDSVNSFFRSIRNPFAN